MATEGSGSPRNQARCSARATGCWRSGPDVGTKPAPAPSLQPRAERHFHGLGGRRQSPDAQAEQSCRRLPPSGDLRDDGAGADILARQPPHLNPPHSPAVPPARGAAATRPAQAGGLQPHPTPALPPASCPSGSQEAAVNSWRLCPRRLAPPPAGRPPTPRQLHEGEVQGLTPRHQKRPLCRAGASRARSRPPSPMEQLHIELFPAHGRAG